MVWYGIIYTQKQAESKAVHKPHSNSNSKEPPSSPLSDSGVVITAEEHTHAGNIHIHIHIRIPYTLYVECMESVWRVYGECMESV